jgi:hypothetical protein
LLPGGEITLETNSVVNSNQQLLNLAAGSGVTLANSAGTTTISASGGSGPSFTTAGQGWFWSNGQVNYPMASNSIISSYEPITTTTNAVHVLQFSLLATYEIRTVSFQVNDQPGGVHFGTGIYTASGTKVLDTGTYAFNGSGSANPISLTLGSPTTLTPAVYYFAWTCDSTDSIFLSAIINLEFWSGLFLGFAFLSSL